MKPKKDQSVLKDNQKTSLLSRVTKKIMFFSLVAILIMLIKEKKDNEIVFYENDVFENRTLTLSEKEIETIEENLKKLGVRTFAKGETEDFILLNALYENENLTEEERKYLTRYHAMIADNPYLNREYVYYVLSNLDIQYKENSSEQEEIVGRFFKDTLTIENYDFEESTTSHEVTHAIHSKYSKYLPNFFKESVTELLRSEYGYESADFLGYAYFPCVPFVKVLCEMVGADPVLKAYTLGDMNILYNEMAKVAGSVEEAKSFLIDFERVSQQRYSSGQPVQMEPEKQEMDTIYEKYAKKVLERDEKENTCHYEFLKYNWNLFTTIFQEKDFEFFYGFSDFDKYELQILENGIARKAYFSSILKETCDPCFDMDFDPEIVTPNQDFEQKVYGKKRG